MTSEDRDESIARIEETQDALRRSIEQSLQLTEQTRQLLLLALAATAAAILLITESDLDFTEDCVGREQAL